MQNVPESLKSKFREKGTIKRGYIKVVPLNDTEEEIIFTDKDIKDFTILDDIYTPDTGIIGSIIAKQIEVNLYKEPTIDLVNREIEAYIGVYGEDTYIPMGTFIIQKPEDNKSNDKTYFLGFNDMIKFNLPYEDTLVYPCTIKDVLKAICEQCEVLYDESSFDTLVNIDFVVENNQFVLNETCREVLQAIAQITGTYAKINEEKKLVLSLPRKNLISSNINSWENGHWSFGSGRKEDYNGRMRYKNLIPIIPGSTIYYSNDYGYGNLIIRTYNKDGTMARALGDRGISGNLRTTSTEYYISVSMYDRTNGGNSVRERFKLAIPYISITMDSSFNETYNSSDYTSDINVNQSYGGSLGVNRLVIDMSVVTGEEIYREDTTMQETDGVQEIRISDNPFLYTEAKRTQAIENLWLQVKGLKYVDFDMKVKTSRPYQDTGDYINIVLPSGESVETILLTHEISYNGTLNSQMKAVAPTETETKYKYVTETQKILTRTEIIVDKSIGEIRSEVELLGDDLNTKMSSITQNLDSITQRVNRFTDFTRTISSLNEKTGIIAPRVVTEDALPTTILGLTIFAENIASGIYPSTTLYSSKTLYPQKAGNKYTLFIASDNAETQYKEYEFTFVSPLKEYNGTHDLIVIEFDQEKGTCSIKVHRYIKKIGNVYTIYDTPIIETISEDTPITLFEGTNYVRLKVDDEFVNWRFDLTYIYGNELNKYYATKIETSSMIKLSEDEIMLQVSRDLGGKADSDKLISLINLSPEEILIQSNKLKLEGYTTINGGFTIDEQGNASISNGAVIINSEGIQMADGTSIVGGKGMMTNLEFVGRSNMTDTMSGNFGQLGFRVNSMNSSNFRAKITIDAYVPMNFTVTKAYVVISHFPMQVNYQQQNKGTGYARDIKIYKENTSSIYRTWNIDSMFFDTDSSTAGEIENAINTSTKSWTPNNELGTVDTLITQDISKSINRGNNRIIIQSSRSIPAYNSGYNNEGTIECALLTGMASATLEIYGFLNFEN